MEEKKIQMVEMTEEEARIYAEMKAERAKREAAEKRKEDRKSLQAIADEALEASVQMVKDLSWNVSETRRNILKIFEPLMGMKRDINQSAEGKDQDSFTFTNTKGNIRVRIGYNMLDNYLPGADDGINLVKEYLQGLGKDEKSQELIAIVMQLLTKDKKGNLKASRVLQLAKLATDSGDEKFMEGMKIIQENFAPTRSSQYIRYEFRNEETKEWESVDTGL